MGNDLLHESQLQRLLDVGRSLVSELDIEVLLGQILETAKELTGARYGALGILDEQKASLERFLNLGIDEATRRGIGPLPQGKGVLGELIRHPSPLRLDRVGDHPRSYGFPPGHPPMNTFLGVPIQIRGEAFGNIYLTEKDDGQPFDERDEAMLVVLAEWAAVAIDNARVYEYSEKRAGELERAVQGLEATVSLSRLGAVETDFESLVELIAKRGRALIDSRSLIILSPRPSGGLVVQHVAGESSIATGQQIVPGSDGVLDLAKEDGQVHHLRGRVFELWTEGPVETDSGLVVHLQHRGRSLGYLLALGHRADRGFTADDELLLQSFATSAASSMASVHDVERDRLRMAIEASEQERKRWAMELHDDTLQDLGALKVMHEGALSLGDPDSMKRSLESASEQLEATIVALESLIHELRPASLDALGISAAVETLVERTSQRGRLEAVTHIDLSFERGDSPSRFTSELEATVYRIVQESLNNTVKHANATKVRVSITEREGEVTVFVEDDGSGFDPSAGSGERFGLYGMRERVKLVGGEMEIDSGPGQGTRVEVHLPVTRRDAIPT